MFISTRPLSRLILSAFFAASSGFSIAGTESNSVGTSNSTSKNNPQECTKLTATGNPEYPPYLFKDSLDPKQLVGANAEILKEIAKSIDIDVDIIYSGPWSRAQQEVKEGRIDLLAGAFFTIPRSQYMDYIHPAFLITRSVVWVNKDSKLKYQEREDLINLKGITVINNSFGQEFDSYAKEKLSIETVPSLTQAFRMMKLGRVDYLLYEESPARAYTQQLRFEDETHTIGPEISSEGLFLTLSHRSPCNTPALRGKLTKALHEVLSKKYNEEALNNGLLKWRNQPGLN